MKTLTPSSISLAKVAEESVNTEPILLLLSPGADPSEELRTLVKTLPNINMREVRECFHSFLILFKNTKNFFSKNECLGCHG